MRILTSRKSILSCFALVISSYYLQAQDQNIAVIQSPKFEQLLNEKRKINTSITINDHYKIQIYNGVSELAKKTLAEFKAEFTTIDGTIIFNTPNYKVWVGSFKTRMEAERNLIEIKRRYKNVFLIKPTK